MIRLLALWAWGAGDPAPIPAPTYTGPSWVMSHHVHSVRCYVPNISPIVIEPGRRFSDDPTLNTFSSLDDEA